MQVKGLERLFRYSPDQGSGSGVPPAPAAAPAAPTAPAPQPAPTVPPPTVDPFRDQLRKLAQAGVRSMTRSLEADPVAGQPSADPVGHLREPAPENRALPEILVGAPAAPSPVTPPPAPPPPEVPAAPDALESPVAEAKPAEPDSADQAPKPTEKAVIMGFDGKPYEFGHDQLRDIIRGYFHYEGQLQGIQQKIDQDRQAVQAERQALEAQKQSDDGLILGFLKKSEVFKTKVLELIDQVPDLATAHQQGQQDLGIKALEDKVNALEKQRQEEITAREQRRLESERQAVVDNVKAKIDAMNANMRLPDRIMEALTAKALQQVQAGRLQFHPDHIVRWFQGEMEAIAADRRAIEDQARNAYLQQKQAAPPPPPSNGGTPPVAPAVLEPGRERVRAVAACLARLGAAT